MKTALLVIDVQKGMIPHLYEAGDFKKNLLDLISKARKKKIPIFYFKFIDTPKNKDRFSDKFWMEKGTSEAELIDELEVNKDDYVFEKNNYNAFSVKDLDVVLKKNKIKTIWLSGLVSHVCVQSTSDGANERDYEVIVVKEAVGATNKENLESGLKWMGKYTSQIVSIKDL